MEPASWPVTLCLMPEQGRRVGTEYVYVAQEKVRDSPGNRVAVFRLPPFVVRIQDPPFSGPSVAVSPICTQVATLRRISLSDVPGRK